MKKCFAILLTGVLLIGGLTGCSKTPATTQDDTKTEIVKLTVGASPIPHAEILKKAKELLVDKNINLEIVEFTDYVQPNIALHEGSLDANFFQHQPYLDNFNKERDLSLTSVGKVHVEPLALYSKTIKNFADIKDGATIAVPNDATNLARALLLLQANGLIKIDEAKGIEATEKDIVENTKSLVFKTVEAASLPRLLEDVDAAVINTNYAIPAGLNPLKDALIIEDAESPYANILATREDNKNAAAIKTLIEVLNGEEIKKFIDEKYNGAIVAAF